MCGICGVYNYRQLDKPVNEELIQAMTEAMKVRGPDDEGAYYEGPLGLGFRRLSIVDLTGGHQPLCDETGKIWLVLNGEIYNYPVLQRELMTRGHKFKTQSDAEVVLHLYQDCGMNLLEKLQGMFAFALWDSNKRLLLLARDRLGIKPLYYYPDFKHISFASSLAGLLCDSGISRKLNLRALNDFFSLRYVLAPDTILEGVKKLEPGHLLLVEPDSFKERQYWDIPLSYGKTFSESEAREELKTKLKKTITSHLMSDVPVAAFLSGGIDSSIVVGAMVEAGVKPKTFSVGFSDEPDYSELKYAKIVADYWGLENYEVIVKPETLKSSLSSIIEALEEPIADPAAIPGYFLSQLAAQQVKVVLTGEGADERFGGYRRYYWAQKREGILSWLSRIGKGFPKLADIFNMDFYHHRTWKFLTEPAPSIAYLENMALFTKSEREALYSPEMYQFVRDGLYPEKIIQSFAQNSEGHDLIERLLYLDTKFWLADDLLIKMDKVSMAHSLEARVPFLDHQLVELSTSIPFSLKYKGKTSKYILRQSMKEVLPPEIMEREKHAFDVPIAEWLRRDLSDYVRSVLLAENTRQSDYFNLSYIEKMLNEHQSGIRNWCFQLWALLNFEIWRRLYL
ncbi:MAG: asparagine synthase (glutamine-hydrolyzing) [Candidatus Edwardsbacteria bacterium]